MGCPAPSNNLGVCEKCKKRVPARHEIREGRVYLLKDCPDCGTTEGLVSNDAAVWQRKREIWQFDPAATTACSLDCAACGKNHRPRMVFLDMTNRCNMNCPICVANAPWMGFEFHPPRAYFENVFRGLAAMDPRPVVHLFGGEPTLRDDLFELMESAHALGLRVHLVTNGLKLADEAYCKRVCDMKVPVFLGFDGRHPDIYQRMRKQTACYPKKMKALENLRKFSLWRQNVIMCTVARHINDAHIADLFAMCYEHRNHIKGLNFLPLTETWEAGRFEADIATTIEDVQEIVHDAFPDDNVEYVSLGLQHHFDRALSFFRSGSASTFAKVHPNCEAATVFLSDGQAYRPISSFLRRPLDELAAEAVQRARSIDGRLARLDRRRAWDRLRGRLVVLRTFGGFLRKAVDWPRVMKGGPRLTALRIIGGLLVGKTLAQQLARHTRVSERLTSIILPFEEAHSVESHRLEHCTAGFAYQDPVTDEVKTLPACIWWFYNKPLLRAITAKYGTAEQPKA